MISEPVLVQPSKLNIIYIPRDMCSFHEATTHQTKKKKKNLGSSVTESILLIETGTSNVPLWFTKEIKGVTKNKINSEV